MSVAGWQVTLSVEEGRERGLTFPLTKPRTIIGRAKADIVLQDGKISSRHASIEISEDGVFITDLDSRNGVHVNDQQVRQQKLKNMDEIMLGLTKMKVLIVEDLGAFRQRNTRQISSEKSPEKGKEDINSLIKDELKKFSRWDVDDDSASGERSDIEIARLNYSLNVLEGPDQGKSFRLNRALMTLGRGKAEVLFKDLDVSRLHASLEISPNGKIVLKDLGSTNGLYLNGKRVTEAQLNLQDEFKIGNTVCRLIRGK